jgi:hypothetical protein
MRLELISTWASMWLNGNRWAGLPRMCYVPTWPQHDVITDDFKLLYEASADSADPIIDSFGAGLTCQAASGSRQVQAALTNGHSSIAYLTTDPAVTYEISA